MIKLPRLGAQYLPLLTTAAVFVALYAVAAVAYPGFASWFQTTALLTDNAPLGMAAVGMTFVIISGGIDLSVGAVIACSSILLARMMVGPEQGGADMPAYLAIPIVLVGGSLFGAGMGALIQTFKLPAFLVTLAGMFLARGIALVATEQKRLSVANEPTFDPLVNFSQFGFTVPALVFLGTVAVAMAVSRYTHTARVVYAIGSAEDSANLMGLPVGRTRVLIYAFSGLCAACGGVLQTIASQAGDASIGFLLELDAIAAVVIGGALLTGGSGFVSGTLLGVLILGIIAVIPTYQGNLNSWWTRIAVGALLLIFIGVQRLLQKRVGKITNHTRG